MVTAFGRRRLRALSASLVALALVLAACGNSDDGEEASAPDTTGQDQSVAVDAPGVTDDEIRFASFGTNSNNPLGTCVLDCFDDGIKAYFEWRNKEGGVHGRDLVLSTELDDELGKNQQRALEIVSANDVFGAFSAPQIASGWRSIADAGIPLYTWSIHPEAIGQKSIFGYGAPGCFDCTQRAVPYVTTLSGARKVASFGYGISENSKLCSQSIKKSVELYSDSIGGPEVVYLNDDLPFGLPNGVGPEVSAMKRAGVDLVAACIDLNGMKTLAQEMQRQGMGDVPMYHLNTYNQQFVAAAGDLFEGDYVAVAFRPFEAEAGKSQLNEFKEWMKKSRSDITEMAMLGWINADLAYQGLVAAGPEFSRKKVIDATNQMTRYSGGGLVNPIDWTRQHEPSTQEDPTTNGYENECVILVQVKDGAFEVVGDRAKPWICWSNKDRKWSEPARMDFE